MFDSYNEQKVTINTANGTIVKNYRKSFFKMFQIGSPLERELFSQKPMMEYKDGYDKSVVVLQVMLCSDKELLAEIMWKEDFDKMFEVESEEEE